jgi:hypothetical protein
MLTDFFLQKRNEYKKGNELQADLEAFFDENFENSIKKGNLAPKFGHPGKDKGDTNSLGFHYMTQTIKKDD